MILVHKGKALRRIYKTLPRGNGHDYSKTGFYGEGDTTSEKSFFARLAIMIRNKKTARAPYGARAAPSWKNG